MSTRWTLDTRGDPIRAVRGVLARVWREGRLDAMLAAADGPDGDAPRLLEDIADLEAVNPFRPLMTSSTARIVPAVRAARPGVALGVLVRPCEMRGLVEMTKHDGFSLEGVVTICVDCLSTLPPEEFRWRVSRHGAGQSVADEALRFAPHGGLVPYRYRSACQQCASPGAYGADVNIGVLGLPVREHLLVWSRDDVVGRRLGLDREASGVAPARLLDDRSRVIGQIEERRERGRQRAYRALGSDWGPAPRAVAALLDGCGDCHACLDACPITAVEPVTRRPDRRFAPEDIAHWLVSCDGCGMCEAACPKDLPLSALFGSVRERLASATGYVPGRSLAEPVPV